MSYLIFEHRGKSKTGLTDRWVVKSKLNPDAILGWIEWHAPWRKYWYCPVNGTSYDSKCLNEIGRFLEDQMEFRHDSLTNHKGDAVYPASGQR